MTIFLAIDGDIYEPPWFTTRIASTILENGAREQDEEHRRSIDALAGSFFADHLHWTGKLTEKALAHANTDFYRSLIRLTADFVAQESLVLLVTEPPTNEPTVD